MLPFLGSFVVASFVLVSAAVHITSNSRDAMLAEARQGVTASARLLATSAENVMRSVEMVADVVEAEWRARDRAGAASDAPRSTDDRRAASALFGRVPTVRGARVVALRTAEPLLVVRATWEPGPADAEVLVADALRLLKGSHATPVVVTAPVFSDGPSGLGRWLVGVARRSSAPSEGAEPAGGYGDPRSDAATVVFLDLEELGQDFHSVDVGARGSAAIVRADGMILARMPYVRANVGRVVTDSPIVGPGMRDLRAGSYDARSVTDGVDRVFAFQRLANAPLILVVSRSRDELMGAWMMEALGAVGLLAPALLLVLASGFYAAVQARRRAQDLGRVREVLETLHEGVLALDAEGRVSFHNARATELLGLPAGLLDARPHHRELVAHQVSHGEFVAGLPTPGIRALETVRLTHEPAIYERRKADGTVLSVRTARLADGGVVRTYSDVTALRRAADADRDARDRAERTDEARSGFVTSLAAEMRTPLTAILGVADVMGAGQLAPERRRALFRLQREAAEQMLALVNDALDVVRVEGGTLELADERVDLAALAEASLAQVAPRAAAKGVRLATVKTPDAPDAVAGDGARLGQILANLLAHAVDEAGGGVVTLRIDAAPHRVGGRRLFRLAVSRDVADADETKAALGFRTLSRLRSDADEPMPGSGLALAITRRLAQAMGGSIEFSSEVGRGSAFTVALPWRAAPAKGGAFGAPLPVEAEAEIGPVAPRRVLLAEDNRASREVLRAMLEGAGHEVVVVSHGVAALETLRRGPAFDLVLMNVHMPIMDGLTAASLIRAEEAFGTLPIVAISAASRASMRERLERAGIRSFLAKPVDLRELLRVVARETNAPSARARRSA